MRLGGELPNSEPAVLSREQLRALRLAAIANSSQQAERSTSGSPVEGSEIDSAVVVSDVVDSSEPDEQVSDSLVEGSEIDSAVVVSDEVDSSELDERLLSEEEMEQILNSLVEEYAAEQREREALASAPVSAIRSVPNSEQEVVRSADPVRVEQLNGSGEEIQELDSEIAERLAREEIEALESESLAIALELQEEAALEGVAVSSLAEQAAVERERLEREAQDFAAALELHHQLNPEGHFTASPSAPAGLGVPAPRARLEPLPIPVVVPPVPAPGSSAPAASVAGSHAPAVNPPVSTNTNYAFLMRVLAHPVTKIVAVVSLVASLMLLGAIVTGPFILPIAAIGLTVAALGFFASRVATEPRQPLTPADEASRSTPV